MVSKVIFWKDFRASIARIGFFFGHISILEYAHFLKKMGISQMGIFMSFQKNGHIANGHIFENYQKMGIL